MKNVQFTRAAWAVLVYNLAVIAWGAVVRATGSGAGCGSHWPLCNGETIPRAPSTATLIEFSHRATSGVALLSVVVLLVWALRAFERGHPARHAAIASMIFMVGEAAIGAGLVLFELVADNESMARALFMGTHLGNTFLLLAALALTVHWGAGGEPLRLRDAFSGTSRRLAWLYVGAFLATLLVGASGAVAALGDTLYPAASHKEAFEQGLSPTSHALIRLRLYHPLIALAAGALLIGVGAHARAVGPSAARRPATALVALVFIEVAAGGINVLLLAPVWMQIVHLLLADLLWITLVWTAATHLATPPPARLAPATSPPATPPRSA